jgi:uncharacterized membrane protein
MKRIAIRFLLFALLGLLIEVFFTWMSRFFSGNFSAQGHTSPIMMLDYGMLGIVTMPLARPMRAHGIPLFLRAVVYMIGIFAVEYVSGIIFTRCLGLHIWDYSHMRFNLQGQITLMFVPCWYTLGLFVEFLYRRVDACALVIARGLTAEEIEQAVAR